MTDSLLVVGSVALDSVETPFGKAEEVLGGSATFFSASASHLAAVKVVGIVGSAFLVLMFVRASPDDGFLFRGGFLLVALATACVIELSPPFGHAGRILASAVIAQPAPPAHRQKGPTSRDGAGFVGSTE